MIPEGFKDIKTHEPPLWEDVIFALEDGRRVMGYFTQNGDGNGECRTNEDKVLKDVIGWRKY